MTTIVIKPDMGVNPAKGSGSGLDGLTRVKSGKLKKKIKVLIFFMKKLRNNSCGYKLYIL
jgi:hypothetical protein